MKLYVKIGFYFLITFYCSNVMAQYVSNGNEPSSMLWNEARTKKFNVIFPDTAREQAELYARLLQRLYQPVSSTLGYDARKIPVIIHPYNLRSNGMVVWAPSRMEIISTAPTDGYGQPWLTQLAIHEYRHVVQTDMMNRGVSRALYYIMGEQALAVPAALAYSWLMEGDAVAAETGLSYTGRGRLASFDMGLRTITLSGKKYSHNKYLLGSYKDYIPNQYEYGYQMVAYGRYKYGEDLWSKVFKFIGNYPITLFPQTFALKKYAGKTSHQFHKETFSFLKEHWSSYKPEQEENVEELLRNRWWDKFDHINYNNMAIMDDSLSILATRTSLSKTAQLVKVEGDKKYTRIKNLGSINGPISYIDDKAYWTEYRPDNRWEQVNYSEVWVYDLTHKKTKRLTHKTRYFSFAINELGEAAAVEKFVNGGQAIILLDSNFVKQKEVRRFGINESLNDLEWIDNYNLVAIHTTEQGMSIRIHNVQSGEYENIVGPTYADLSGVAIADTCLFFSSGYNGIENIYAVSLENRNIYRLTNVMYGAVDPDLSADKKHLIYTQYTPKGYKPMKKPLDSLIWEKVPFGSSSRFMLAENLSKQEQFRADTAKLDSSALDLKPYSKTKHLFRFHSWAPAFYYANSIMSTDVTIGAKVISQNNLSTAFTEIGYQYDRGFHSGHASFTYTGWYPVVSVSGQVGGENPIYRDYVDGYSYTEDRLYTKVNADIYVPLNFSRGDMLGYFTPFISLGLSGDKIRFSEKRGYKQDFTTNLGISIEGYTRMAQRDINPKFGVGVNLSMLACPLLERLNQIFTLRGTLYLPGLLPNHSIVLKGGMEKQRVPILYKTRLPIPRGITRARSHTDIISGSANYTFPLLYPDLNLGFFAYVKRIRLNVFADGMWFQDVERTVSSTGSVQTRSEKMYSAGYECTFDFHLFRIPYMISMGWRSSWTYDNTFGGVQRGTFTEVLASITIQ